MTVDISPSPSFKYLDEYIGVDYRCGQYANEEVKTLNAKDRLFELIQRVEDDNVCTSMMVEMKRLLADHDRLVTMLQQRSETLENDISKLKSSLGESQRRYEKAVREMQFFKKKYEKVSVEVTKTIVQQRLQTYDMGSASRSENYSCSSSLSQPPPPHFSSSSSSAAAALTSCAPSASSMTSTSSMDSNAYTNHEPTELARRKSMAGHVPSSTYCQSTASSMSSICEDMPSRSRKNSIVASVYSTLSTLTDHTLSTQISEKSPPSGKRKSSWYFSRNPSTSSSYSSRATSIASCNASMYSVPVTPARSTNNNGYNYSAMIQQRRVDPLTFGASDGLWDTISKSHGNDTASEKVISNFLRRGGSPNTARQSPSSGNVKYGYGLLHAVVTNKATASLDLLLEQGANPNALTISEADADKVMPIYLAASVGWMDGLERLIQAGADLLNARGEGVQRKTALHVAAEHGHAAAVEFIVTTTRGALSPELDSQGATALHYACASGHAEIVSFLARSCQVPVKQTDHHNELPLHWATRQGQLEVVALLIEQFGNDFNAYVSRKVGTPLDIAKASGHKRLVDYLKGLGALTAKKLDKRRGDVQLNKNEPKGLQDLLSKNGF